MNKTTNATLLLCLLLTTICAWSKSEVDKAVGLLESERTRKKGVATLSKLARSRKPEIAFPALLAVAPYLRKQSFAKYEKLVLRHEPGIKPNLKYPTVEGHAEYARYLAFKKETAKAIQLVRNWIEKCDGLPKVVCLETGGDCNREIPNHKEAIAQYRSALKFGRDFFKITKSISPGEKDGKAKPLHKEWKLIEKRIIQKLEDTEREFRIFSYGIDFVLYEEAREKHLAGETKKALTRYNLVIKTAGRQNIYSEASAYYRCLCAVGNDEQLKQLRSFYSEQANGLYRGEALLSIATILLYEMNDLGAATKSYQEAIDWFVRARRLNDANKYYQVPDKSKVVSKPPANYVRLKGGYVVAPVNMEPGNLINRHTSPWYLNSMEERARLGAVVCAISARDWDRAAAQLAPIPSLNPAVRSLQQRKLTNPFFRLQHACKNRHMSFFEKELKGVKASYYHRMVQADVTYLLGNFEDSLKQWKSILKRAKRKDDRRTTPVAMIGTANLELVHGNRRAAVRYLTQVAEHHSNSPAFARACFYLGNIHGQKLSDSEGLQKAIRFYRKAIGHDPSSRIAQLVRLPLGSTLAACKQYDEAALIAESLQGREKKLLLDDIKFYRKFYKERKL